MVGNKADVAMEEREVPREEAEAYAAANGAIYIETSAYTGNNVDQLFKDLGKSVIGWLWKRLSAIYIETSAYTGNNVDQLFKDLGKSVIGWLWKRLALNRMTPHKG